MTGLEIIQVISEPTEKAGRHIVDPENERIKHGNGRYTTLDKQQAIADKMLRPKRVQTKGLSLDR